MHPRPHCAPAVWSAGPHKVCNSITQWRSTHDLSSALCLFAGIRAHTTSRMCMSSPHPSTENLDIKLTSLMLSNRLQGRGQERCHLAWPGVLLLIRWSWQSKRSRPKVVPTWALPADWQQLLLGPSRQRSER